MKSFGASVASSSIIISHKTCGQGARGTGTRHVVYWRHTKENGVQPLKVNLIIYDNDILQVKIFLQCYFILLVGRTCCGSGHRVQLLSLGSGVLSMHGEAGGVPDAGGN